MMLRKLMLLGTLTVLACAPRSAMQDETGMPAPYAPATVTIENFNWSDVDVYAVTGSQMYRLATASTNRKVVAEVPEVFVLSSGAFRLYVDPIGGTGAYLSDLITVNPGDDVRLTVANAIRQSTYTIQ